MNTYDLFKGKDLEIAELIQRRRLQMLVHSCIYYEYNRNIISDKTWDEWARELRTLQEHYPNIAEKVMWHEAFKDWDARTGAFLPLKDPWVQKKAKWLLGLVSFKDSTEPKKLKDTKVGSKIGSKKVVKKRLF